VLAKLKYGGWKKSCTSWQVVYPTSYRIIIGFQPSKVVQDLFHPQYVDFQFQTWSRTVHVLEGTSSRFCQVLGEDRNIMVY
jgi:hypothetical protein